jgi:hypothetical protein
MKTLSSLFIVSILFQSCIAYKRSSSTLSESNNLGRVLVITTVGEKLKFKKIIFRDSVFYGIKYEKIKKASGGNEVMEVAVLLNPDFIQSIHLQDKVGSIGLDLLALGVVGVVAWGIGILLVFYVIGFGG